MSESATSYCCPLCGGNGLRSEKGFRIHVARRHREIVKSDIPDIWAKVVSSQTKVVLPEVEEIIPINKACCEGDPVAQCGTPEVVPAKPKLSLVPAMLPEEYAAVEDAFSGEEPQSVRLTAVPKGTKIYLSGMVFRQAGESWEAVQVDGVTATVGLRQATEDGSVWLYLRYGGEVFSLNEAEVLAGSHVIKSIPEVSPVSEPVGTVEVEESQEEKEFRESLPKFKNALLEYAKADLEAKVAKKAFDDVRKTHYDYLCDFVRKYGSETDKDKGDFRIREFGYSSHLIRVPGCDRVVYNTDAIIQWCIQTGNEACLKKTLDVEAWNNLKAQGLVPGSIVSLYENTISGEDTFRLQIKKDAEV